MNRTFIIPCHDQLTHLYEVVGGAKDPATEKYIKEKLEVLEDFHITLTEEQIEHMRSLATKLEVDRFVRDLIRNELKGEENE